LVGEQCAEKNFCDRSAEGFVECSLCVGVEVSVFGGGLVGLQGDGQGGRRWVEGWVIRELIEELMERQTALGIVVCCCCRVCFEVVVVEDSIAKGAETASRADGGEMVVTSCLDVVSHGRNTTFQ
jgi:hypothetical protein